MRFHIENMSCGGCVEGVGKVIRSVDPAAGVTADPAGRKVEIVSGLPRGAFEAALAQAGYPAAQAAGRREEMR